MTKHNDAVVASVSKNKSASGRGAGVKRTRWTDKEWADIFSAIHSMFPELNLQDCRNVDTKVIQPHHVKSAMMACIPISRHHSTFKQAAYMDKLVSARADFAATLPKPVEPVQKKTTLTAEAVRKQANALFTAPPPAPTPKPEPKLHEINQYESLFKTMLGMVSASIAAQIVPQMHENIKHAVTTAYAAGAASSNQQIMDAIAEMRNDHAKFATEVRQRVVATPNPAPVVAPINTTALLASISSMLDNKLEGLMEMMTAPSPEPQFVTKHAAEPVIEVVKKRRIGLLGPMPDQVQDIRRAFPQVDFVAEEGSSKNAKNAFRTCECVITMKKLSNHSVGDQIKAQFGRNFHLVLGGVSSVKSQIQNVLNGATSH